MDLFHPDTTRFRETIATLGQPCAFSIPFFAIFVEYLAELELFSYLTASLSLINRSCWALVLQNRGIYKRLIEKTMGEE